jgi:Listeria-Bacteroides repeat domain (List_Bact_rpt)
MAGGHVYNSGWKSIKSIFVYNGGWKSVKGGWVYNNGWRKFFSSQGSIPSIQNSGGTEISTAYVGDRLYGYPGAGTTGTWTYAFEYSTNSGATWSTVTTNGGGTGTGTGVNRYYHTTILSDDNTLMRFSVTENGIKRSSNSVSITKYTPVLNTASYSTDPVLSGNATVSSTLTFTAHWSPTTNITNDTLPDSFDVYWYSSQTGITTHNILTGVTTASDTYTIQSSDVGGTISVYMTATNSGGTTTTSTRTTATIANLPSAPTFTISRGSATSQGWIRVNGGTNATSITLYVYRATNGYGVNSYGYLNTYSYYDYETVYASSSPSTYYWMPENGYYYIMAYASNASGSSATVYSNTNGQTGTVTNWFYCGIPESPSAGSSPYVSGNQITVYWNPYSYDNANASIHNNVNGSAASYEIWYQLNSTPTPSNSYTADFTGISPSATSYTDTAGYSVQRSYFIRGRNANGAGSWVFLGTGTTGAAPTYTVYYSGNGGTTPSSSTVTQGNSVTLPSTSRSGYSFKGWYDSSGNFVGSNGSSYTPSYSTTLTAYWDSYGSCTYYQTTTGTPYCSGYTYITPITDNYRRSHYVNDVFTDYDTSGCTQVDQSTSVANSSTCGYVAQVCHYSDQGSTYFSPDCYTIPPATYTGTGTYSVSGPCCPTINKTATKWNCLPQDVTNSASNDYYNCYSSGACTALHATGVYGARTACAWRA